MATHDYIISNASGAAVRADLNNALAAIASNNSSATEPATTYAYQWWADTGSSPTVMKLRNAANSAWITLFQLDGEWNLLPVENGTAAAPSIYFKDSGTDTGIYSPGTDQVGISAGGTSRFEISTSATTSTLPVVHPLGAVATPSITFTGDLNTGIWSPAADTIAFSEGGTEAMRIDSSGRLLVGTPSSSGGKVEIASSTNGDGIRLVYANTPTGSTGPAIVFASHNNNGVPIATSSIQGNLTGGGVGVEAGNIIFNTLVGGGTLQERMRIHADGNISVGTSLNNGRIAIAANVPATVGNRIVLLSSIGAGDVGMEAIGISKFDNNSSTSQVFVRFYQNNGTSGSGQINANGASAVAFGSFSDQRLKENIEELPPQYENIKNLRPVEFDYKDGSGHQIGFIAQEMQEVYPDTVSAGSDEMLTLTGWSKTEARLVKALQEAIAKIEALEAKVAALEAA